MEKMKLVKYKELNYYEMQKTKYDNLFRDVIRNRGIYYYRDNKVTKFHKSKNKISAILKGQKDYKVFVEYIDDNKIKVKCECPYHKETDIYCKHVYALLITLKMMYELDNVTNIYNKNINRIKEINDLISIIIKDNEKYVDNFTMSWSYDVRKKYDDEIEKYNQLFNNKNGFQMVGVTNNSYYLLNEIISDYNLIISNIEEEKQEEKKRMEYNKNSKTTHTYTIGEGVFDAIDNIIAEVPLPILEKVRQDDIEKGEDTSIMDKAIKERKRRDELIRKQQERQYKIEKEYQKKMRKKLRRAVFFGLLKGIFDGLNSMDSIYPKK